MRETTAADRRLGASVRELREALGRTLKDVAQEIGVSASLLSYIEAGKRRASSAVLERATDALGVREALGMSLTDLRERLEGVALGGAPQHAAPAAVHEMSPLDYKLAYLRPYLEAHPAAVNVLGRLAALEASDEELARVAHRLPTWLRGEPERSYLLLRPRA